MYAYNNLGNVCQDMGDLNAAINCYEKAIEISGSYPAAQFSVYGGVLQETLKLGGKYKWRFRKLLILQYFMRHQTVCLAKT